VPPIPNPIRGCLIEGGAPLGPIAAFEQSTAILSQRDVQAECVAQEAAADAQEMKNAHATIVSQHQKMFLQTTFGINPDGTPITNLSLCPDKLKKYNSVKSVEQYNDMINIITNWGGDAVLKEASPDDPEKAAIIKFCREKPQGCTTSGYLRLRRPKLSTGPQR
jgi:hypothetical protein